MSHSEQRNRAVHVVSFDPVEGAEVAIGGLNWFFSETAAHMEYQMLTLDPEVSAESIVALWSLYVPYSWDEDTVTDYLDEALWTDSAGYPVLVHNAPHDNWPHPEADTDEH